MPKTKIAFLDAGTVDWKDQDFKPLKNLGILRRYHTSSYPQTAARSSNFKHVITNKVIFDRKILSDLEGVAAVHVAATGVNNIDLDAARENGIAVTNVRGYSTESVVQITFAAMLALASRLPEYQKAIQRGDWSRQPFFSLTSLPFNELAGKTLGIIGYGTIGKRISEVARALGMKILIARIPGRKYSTKISRVTLKQLLKQADIVTIHAPLSEKTKGLIGAGELAQMKKTAFLLNMARGGIVDENALVKALKQKWIAGAASDVLSQEPPKLRSVMYTIPKLILTPHIAWASVEARRRLIEEVARNIESFEKGGKRNRLV